MKRTNALEKCTRRRILGVAGGALPAGVLALGTVSSRETASEATSESSASSYRSKRQAENSKGASSTEESDAASQEEAPSVVAEHDGRTFSVEPLQGDVPITELYHYQLPEQYTSEENGATDDDGSYYQVTGLEDLRRDDTTVTFLYNGPEGLSLVVIHDNPGESPHGGGAVTWTITDVPETGQWVVRDDLYRDPKTGERAETNYDEWDISGKDHVIDWTWGESRADGGVLQGLGDSFDVEIEPAFNEDAALYDRYYEGTVTDWIVLSGDYSDPESISLCRLEPLCLKADGN